jgi:hypothetical protein
MLRALVLSNVGDTSPNIVNIDSWFCCLLNEDGLFSVFNCWLMPTYIQPLLGHKTITNSPK